MIKSGCFFPTFQAYTYVENLNNWHDYINRFLFLFGLIIIITGCLKKLEPIYFSVLIAYIFNLKNNPPLTWNYEAVNARTNELKLIYTGTYIHRNLYTQELIYTGTCIHRNLYTQELIYTGTYIHRNL